MSKLREQLLAVATWNAADRGRSLLRFLGDGNDGAVWESDQQSAMKALERRDSYLRERDAYLRLQDLGIVDIQGFAVPCLIDLDDTIQIVEMTVVFPPCVLDFAKAYVDSPPDFSAEVLRDWEEETAELFDADWHQVKRPIKELRDVVIDSNYWKSLCSTPFGINVNRTPLYDSRHPRYPVLNAFRHQRKSNKARAKKWNR